MATKTREAWLESAVRALQPIFTSAGETIPPVRVSVGWPGGRGSKSSTIGQCWASVTASDAVPQIFISPVLDDAIRVLDVLAHEIVHAVDDCQSQHKGKFVKIARAIGLEGKPTATVASAELTVKLAKIVDKLGPYPHAALSTQGGGKKQTTRLLKVECTVTGEYVARITRKWLEELGAPICPCHELTMVES